MAICADRPGRFAEGDVVLQGQRALVREGSGRIMLTLLSGTRLRAEGYDVSGAAPVSVTFAQGAISGEANLAQAGETRLRLPGGTAAKMATVTVGGVDRQIPLEREGDTIRLSLPSGKSRFEIRS